MAFKKVEADSDSEKKLDAATDKDSHVDRKLLHNVARMSLHTQLSHELADHPTDIVVETVLAVRNTGRGRAQSHINLDIMIIAHKTEFDTKLVKA